MFILFYKAEIIVRHKSIFSEICTKILKVSFMESAPKSVRFWCRFRKNTFIPHFGADYGKNTFM